MTGLYAAGYYDKIPDIPVLLMSSWYDVYVPTTFENLAGLGHGNHRPQVIMGRGLIIMGPWTHCNRTKRVFGDVDFGPEAIFDGYVGDNWCAFRIACFDRWLKRADAPTNDASIRLFPMGGGLGISGARHSLSTHRAEYIDR